VLPPLPETGDDHGALQLGERVERPSDLGAPLDLLEAHRAEHPPQRAQVDGRMTGSVSVVVDEQVVGYREQPGPRRDRASLAVGVAPRPGTGERLGREVFGLLPVAPKSPLEVADHGWVLPLPDRKSTRLNSSHLPL